MESRDYKEYSCIGDYIKERLADCPAPDEETAKHFKTMQRKDEALRKKYRPKKCPMANFEPCREDDCAVFDNPMPGLPWWGKCQLGRSGGME